jgi:transmembrane sensor
MADDMDALLTRYFAGQASPEEAMQVDDWSISNRAEFDSLWQIWNETTGRPHRLPEAKLVWEEMKFTKPVVLWRRSLVWVAAAVLLGAIVATALLIMPAKQQTIVAVNGRITHVTLPDSTKAELVHGSLSYPSSFGGKRVVVLSAGGAGRFDIHTDPAHPFTLKTGALQIKVLGTSFYVADSGKVVTVQVYTGQVLVLSDAQHSIILNAGQTATFQKSGGGLAITSATLSFDNEEMEDVAATLSKTFHKKITFRNPSTSRLRVSSVFENQSLDYILEVLATTLDLRYTYVTQDEIIFE